MAESVGPEISKPFGSKEISMNINLRNRIIVTVGAHRDAARRERHPWRRVAPAPPVVAHPVRRGQRHRTGRLKITVQNRSRREIFRWCGWTVGEVPQTTVANDSADRGRTGGSVAHLTSMPTL
jgi:hypothetical protein